MRPLTETETEAVFSKLARYIGQNVMHLLKPNDEPHVFRFHQDRVYYLSEKLLKSLDWVNRKQLISAGICFGKFTKTHKFKLGITCLDYLARFAVYKAWLKPAGEQAFVYGNNVIRRHLGKITENVAQNAGVVVLSMTDVPLGFGVTAKTTDSIRNSDTEVIVIYHQSDIGEYLRDEADLV